MLPEFEAWAAAVMVTEKAYKKATRRPRWDRPDDTSGSQDAYNAYLDASLAEKRALVALRRAVLAQRSVNHA